MTSWSTVGYGAALSAAGAGILVRTRRQGQRLAAGITAALGRA